MTGPLPHSSVCVKFSLLSEFSFVSVSVKMVHIPRHQYFLHHLGDYSRSQGEILAEKTIRDRPRTDEIEKTKNNTT